VRGLWKVFGPKAAQVPQNPELRALRRTKVSMVFQNIGLLPHRTVLENITYGLQIRGVRKPDWVRRGMEVIELVGLDSLDG